ncbi:hypothetical protein PGUG_01195 [Meyerozyma guilliermondii ATCC 6260]|uniref:NAD(P)-binding protein n=1 Tax=Meyerozyma guilliermondii (strain ATCC 6260 / CBS 566 / DSM 6381 / JCM 1539 / NBRC 10279 / NRRL Y-324) TaxID=294746 RepID=A5DD40_PICGU|nr:uncharacterized protein PGUG_01195 [Meyerozyma guilliermondii ATCC 6260]EDK37097.2 hypothetical protein PGUG_01195 [Meyerozyma guilliermondii ATCC 6260]
MASFTEKFGNLYNNNLCPSKPKFLPEDYPDLTGKTVLVTGANAGIGYETTKLLLEAGAQVLVVVRSLEKMKAAEDKLKSEGAETSRLEIFEGDFSDLASIGKCGKNIVEKQSEIHIVIHNAGVMLPPRGSVTKQDYDLQLGVNALAPYLLQKYLDPVVLAAKTDQFVPRVIWVSSNSYLFAPGPRGLLPYEEINDKDGKSTLFALYGQSKVALNYNALIYAEKYKGKIITAALNPGGLKTDLQRNTSAFEQWLARSLLKDPVYGSYTELYAALSPDITVENSGCFVRPWGQIEEYCGFIKQGLKDGTAKKLNEWTEEQIAPYYQ